MPLHAVSCEVQKLMEIRVPVVEGREEEGRIRLLHTPVIAAGQEGPGRRIIAEPLLQKGHGTDAAENEGIDIVRGIVQQDAVLRLRRNIVHAVGQQNQILSRKIISGNHPVEKVLHQRVVLQRRLLQRIEHGLMSPGLLLRQRKAGIEQIPPEASRHGLLEQLAILGHLLVLQRQKGVMQRIDLLLVLVHVAAPHPVDAAVRLPEALFDFRYRLLIHVPPS